MLKLPNIALIGPSGAGKDTAAAYLASITDLRWCGSLSGLICGRIARELGVTFEEAWRTRHDNWQYWRDWCNNYRKDDLTRLVREAMLCSNLISGVRSSTELLASRIAGLLDIIVWIDNPRVPEDPTLDITKYDCDLVICNEADLERFHYRLRKFCTLACIGK